MSWHSTSTRGEKVIDCPTGMTEEQIRERGENGDVNYYELETLCNQDAGTIAKTLGDFAYIIGQFTYQGGQHQ
ncbi:MAG: hypothetical protein HC774_01575 [Sphingomonadales bacterium]|nr:hypothetical protein [Sphingomonadales bacterium]